MTTKIEWVNRYPLKGVPGHFVIYISKHSDEQFHGAVVYYIKTGSWSKGEMIELHSDIHMELAHSLEDVLDTCLTWARSKFGETVQVGDPERVQ